MLIFLLPLTIITAMGAGLWVAQPQKRLSQPGFEICGQRRRKSVAEIFIIFTPLPKEQAVYDDLRDAKVFDPFDTLLRYWPEYE